MKLHIILEPSKEGGFTVTVPALPRYISEGETRKEAIANNELPRSKLRGIYPERFILDICIKKEP